MSNQHPFTNPDPFFDQGHQVKPRRRGSRWLLVLGVVFGLGFLFCGGVLVASYVALQQVAGGIGPVDLPEALPDRIDEEKNFNQSLAGFVADPSNDPCVDPDVCDFVRESLVKLRDYDTIPFSREMFVQAVMRSPAGNGQVGIVERVSILSWLAEYEPVPYVDEPYERILAVRLNPEGDLATVDLLLYSAESQAKSEQWYLVKEDEEWKLYDWNRLEYGRRMSDEYAGYVVSESVDAEGYDIAMNELDEAEGLYFEGEEERAREMIRQCETKPMLPNDRTVALLRTAYTWMSIDEMEETVRVLKMIPNPDQVWGVWPVLAACHFNLGRNEEALEAIERAEKLSPDHPNVHVLYSAILRDLGRDSEAVVHAALALRFFPRDPTVMSDLIGFDRAEDIPLLLDCMLESTDPFAWDQVLDHGAGDSRWGEQLVAAAKEHEELPVGFVTLAEANLAWSRSDFDRSAELFLQAAGEVQMPMLREIANRDHLSARVESGNIGALISESGDTDALKRLFANALEDDLSIKPQVIVDALEKNDTGDSMWAIGLRGYANHELRNYPDALTDFEAFYAWVNDQSDIDAWIVDYVRGFVIEGLVETNRAAEVLDRWPDNVEYLHQWGALLLQPHQQEQRNQILAAFPEDASDGARLQRFRLLAQQASVNREPALCDQHHREAIEIANSLDESSYFIASLIRKRAEHAVCHRFEEISDEALESFVAADGFDFRSTFFESAVGEATILNDESTTRLWMERAKQKGLDNDETWVEMQASLAQLLFETGQYEEAAENYLAAYENSQDRENWRARDRRRGFVDSLLALGRFDELRQWLDEQGEPRVWDDAAIMLKAGDSEALMNLFSEQSEDEVIAWLRRTYPRNELERQSDRPWVDELLSKYTLYVGYRSQVNNGSLLLDSDELPSAEGMQRMVQSVAGSDGDLRKVNTRVEDIHSWLATTPGGQRVVVSFQVAQYIAELAPPALTDRLEKPVLRIFLQMDDRLPDSPKRMLEAASRLVNEQAFAFSWEDHDVLWIGDGLAERLQWDDRVPLDTALSRTRLTLDSVWGDDDSLSLEQWETKLSQSEDKRVPVLVSPRLGTTVEERSAHLVGVDWDDYEVHVEMDEDHVLNPLAKKGRRFTMNVANVRPLDD